MRASSVQWRSVRGRGRFGFVLPGDAPQFCQQQGSVAVRLQIEVMDVAPPRGDAAGMQHPARGTVVEPGQHDKIATRFPQSLGFGAAFRQVVKVRNPQ